MALGGDSDRDGFADFEDNCPAEPNGVQADSDADGMGDACDPEPGAAPSFDCDGFEDELDGYLDTDGDGWGDPCDHQPTRDDSYPGAPELCDGRDNDGDALFASGELTDDDFDLDVACGDCDETEPEVHVCACELCLNAREDDCDGLMDGAGAAGPRSRAPSTSSGEAWATCSSRAARWTWARWSASRAVWAGTG
jgi:hypothetical protein